MSERKIILNRFKLKKRSKQNRFFFRVTKAFLIQKENHLPASSRSLTNSMLDLITAQSKADRPSLSLLFTSSPWGKKRVIKFSDSLCQSLILHYLFTQFVRSKPSNKQQMQCMLSAILLALAGPVSPSSPTGCYL